MENQVTREMVESLKKMRGEVRGICLKTDWEFILREKGKEGIKKLEEKMEEWGVPIKFEEIKTMDFYPVGFDGISLLAIKEVFGYGEEDFERIGREAIKFSFFLKIFMKYFPVLDTLIKEVPKMWRKHYTVGEIEIPLFSLKEKKAIIILKDFNINAQLCAAHRGYFSKLLEMAISKKIRCQETECTFSGGKHHQFLLTWD